jgi:hypothetical protein
MIRRRQSAALLLTFLTLTPTVALAANRPFGAIAGIVKDDAGNPIIGAMVKLMEPGSSEPVKAVRSDMQGKFIARNIAPGQYRLRAEARGFISAAQPIAVKPEIISSFNFELKRIGTMVESRQDRDDYRWTVRASRRPVLRFNKNGESAGDDAISALALMRGRIPRGMVQFVSGIPIGNVKPLGAYSAANFAIVNEVAPNLDVIVAGQLTNSDTTPNRIEVTALASPSDDHRLAVSVGMANLRPIGATGLLPRVRQFSLRVADAWQMPGPFMIVYGVDLTSLTGAGSRFTVVPRFGIKLTAADRTHIMAELFPVRSQDIQTTFDYDGGQIVFTQPETPAVVNGTPVADRSRRFQFSFERALSDTSSVEAAVFLDQVSGRGVGLLAVPVGDAADQQSVYQAITQKGETSGVRVTYSHRLTELLRATVGYAFGQGQKLSAAGLIESSPYFVKGLFHVFSARIDTVCPWTRTRVAINFRAAPPNAVFAIDPFYRPPVGEFPLVAATPEAAFPAAANRFQIFDPTVSLVLTQELPALPFLPGRWEASIEARNLLNANSGIESDARSLFINRLYRSIRGSLAVRF